MVLASVIVRVVLAMFGLDATDAAGVPSARETEAIPWLREADDIPWAREGDTVPETREVAPAVPAEREVDPDPAPAIPPTRDVEFAPPSTREG